MQYANPLQVANVLFDKYYIERNVQAIIECVTSDIIWVGTERNDCADGKEELRALLKADLEVYPDAFQVEVCKSEIRFLDNDIALVKIKALQAGTTKDEPGLHLRGTATCINTAEGWKVNSVHFSVPNAQKDKYYFRKLADEKKKEETERVMREQNERLSKALRVAEKASRAKTDFLSTVSHDMRTPLNGILGLTHLLLEREEDENKRRDLHRLENSGHYLLNLINDTLDVNKIESGKLELHPRVYDEKNLVSNVLSLMKPSLDAKNIKMNLHIEELPYMKIYVDAGRLEQVIMNIVGNAIKFTSEGGTIDVYMRNIYVRDGIIKNEMIVQDTGIGMSKEFVPHIFEAFAQENQNTTTNYQGTGLGMTISQKILELMEGNISIESQLKKGTIVKMTFCMPIATKEQIEMTNNISGDVQEELNGKRILLCEDHPLNAEIAKRILDKKGVLVDHAESGRVGLEMFCDSEAGYYDGILMDIRMPELDGFETTEQIRKSRHPQARTIPIIAMTANAFESDVQECLRRGMNAHISKPIEPNVLFRTLSEKLSVDYKVSVNGISNHLLYHEKGSILVVDDVKLNANVIGNALLREYNVLYAENGLEAKEILKKNTDIIAVITDVQMPIMNGKELIRYIRGEQRYRYIAVLANTQYGNENQEEELLTLGADDFLYKTVSPKIISMRLKNVLRKYGR